MAIPGCDGPCNAGGDFGIAAVDDDLDDRDALIVSEGLTEMGLRLTSEDMDASSASLLGLLGHDLDALYFTGHGQEGAVRTADGEVGSSDTVIAVENTIFATCLTLAPAWDEAFGPSAQTLLGYSDTTLDFVDNEVAMALVESLAAGSHYLAAWFLANAPIESTCDRWVGYAREGTAVVEYSARSSRSPVLGSLPEDCSLVDFGDGGLLQVDQSLLRDERLFEGQVARLEARVGPIASGAVSTALDRLEVTSLSSDDAVVVAQAFVDRVLGGLPTDAMTPTVTPLSARRPGEPPATVGYVVRHGRLVGGMPVAGNGVADHILVLVGDAGALAWTWYWPDIEVSGPEPWLPSELLSPADAVRSAAEDIARSAKGNLRLSWARPVYGTRGPGATPRELVPAWQLGGPDGVIAVVDAVDGVLLI